MIKYLLLFLISFNAFSIEYNRAVIQRDLNGQRIYFYGPGGSPGKEVEIIWDSQKDGPLPPMADYEIVSKSGNTLVVDPVKQQAKLDKATLEQIKKNQEGAVREEFATLKVKLESETATAAEIRRLLKLYLKLKGE